MDMRKMGAFHGDEELKQKTLDIVRRRADGVHGAVGEEKSGIVPVCCRDLSYGFVWADTPGRPTVGDLVVALSACPQDRPVAGMRRGEVTGCYGVAICRDMSGATGVCLVVDDE